MVTFSRSGMISSKMSLRWPDALDGIDPIERVAIEQVGTGPAIDHIVAGPTGGGVRACPPVERVVSRPTFERVIAIAALDQISAAISGQRVVPCQAPDRIGT